VKPEKVLQEDDSFGSGAGVGRAHDRQAIGDTVGLPQKIVEQVGTATDHGADGASGFALHLHHRRPMRFVGPVSEEACLLRPVKPNAYLGAGVRQERRHQGHVLLLVSELLQAG
jgi:hypothetical protein